MMKMEDYNIQLSDSEEEIIESVEYSMTESIGGESFYKYTTSAEQKYSKRYILQKQIEDNKLTKKETTKHAHNTANTPRDNVPRAGAKRGFK
jgi:hypothetical protein